MDTTDILAFEEDRLSEEETIALFQHLIDEGIVWKMQGSYGRPDGLGAHRAGQVHARAGWSPRLLRQLRSLPARSQTGNERLAGIPPCTTGEERSSITGAGVGPERLPPLCEREGAGGMSWSERYGSPATSRGQQLAVTPITADLSLAAPFRRARASFLQTTMPCFWACVRGSHELCLPRENRHRHSVRTLERARQAS